MLNLWLLRILAIFVGLAIVREIRRRRVARKNELREVRDRDQVALFSKEPPLKPTFVARAVVRVACARCRELTDVTTLVAHEGVGRVCGDCAEEVAPESPSTYRGG